MVTPQRLAVGVAAIFGAGVITAATLAGTAAGQPPNPPGANGTVKIDADEGGGINNEPHVGCEFALNFFNFDDDDRANLTFTAQPPTVEGAEALATRQNVAIGGDPTVIPFAIGDLDLTGIEPHPQQGFHVKLTVEIIGEPGAGKHKVFWIECLKTPTPTKSPTKSPSPSPTKSPTKSPSPSPTKSPTPSPTDP